MRRGPLLPVVGSRTRRGTCCRRPASFIAWLFIVAVAAYVAVIVAVFGGGAINPRGGPRMLARSGRIARAVDPRKVPAGVVGISPPRTAPPRDDPPRRIPRILHQTYPGRRLPDRLAAIVATWRRLNPTLYDDAAARSTVAAAAPRWLPSYDALSSAVERADVFRYAALMRHGGVYADVDAECFQPLDTYLMPGDTLVVGWEGLFESDQRALDWRFVRRHQVLQWAVAAAASHPALRSLGDHIAQSMAPGSSVHYGSPRRGILERTGPGPFTDAVLTAWARWAAASGGGDPHAPPWIEPPSSPWDGVDDDGVPRPPLPPSPPPSPSLGGGDDGSTPHSGVDPVGYEYDMGEDDGDTPGERQARAVAHAHAGAAGGARRRALLSPPQAPGYHQNDPLSWPVRLLPVMAFGLTPAGRTTGGFALAAPDLKLGHHFLGMWKPGGWRTLPQTLRELPGRLARVGRPTAPEPAFDAEPLVGMVTPDVAVSVSWDPPLQMYVHPPAGHARRSAAGPPGDVGDESVDIVTWGRHQAGLSPWCRPSPAELFAAAMASAAGVKGGEPTVVDLGAGLGLFTLSLASSGCHVIAIEPDGAAANGASMPLLRRSAALNGLSARVSPHATLQAVEADAALWKHLWRSGGGAWGLRLAARATWGLESQPVELLASAKRLMRDVSPAVVLLEVVSGGPGGLSPRDLALLVPTMHGWGYDALVYAGAACGRVGVQRDGGPTGADHVTGVGASGAGLGDGGAVDWGAYRWGAAGAWCYAERSVWGDVFAKLKDGSPEQMIFFKH